MSYNIQEKLNTTEKIHILNCANYYFSLQLLQGSNTLWTFASS